MAADRKEMAGIAQSYTEELSAQFQRLNNFVREAKGEIGRVHESYLRGVIRRLLPFKLKVGTGFIAAPGMVSSQQDIIIFNHVDYAVLFEVAECLVVDYNAVVAALEVKTALESEQDLIECIRKLARTKPAARCNGVYAWRGMTADSAIAALARFIMQDGEGAYDSRPTLIYISSRCLLIRNDVGKVDSPYSVLRLDDGTFSEGEAILALLATIWLYGVQLHVPDVEWPWWLQDWFDRIRAQASPTHWPKELMETLNSWDAARRSKQQTP